MPSVIEARGVSKRFLLHHNPSGELKVRFLGLLHRSQKHTVEEFWALRDISLAIGRGEALGLIGRNGSGKSTFLKLIAAIHRPTSGQLLVARRARIGTMIELGLGFHPELTGTENVHLNAAIHGLGKDDIAALYPAVVKYSGLEHFMDVPLKNFSSGMHMRLGFSIAANLDPDILLLDEIFAVGDEDFQKQCMRTLKTFESRGKTIVFVSHSSAAVKAICHRVCLLDRGRLLFDGEVDAGLSQYQRLVSSNGGDPSAAPSVHPVAPADQLSDRDMDLASHRVMAGGRWAESGDWQFDFLQRHGLKPHQYVLDVGCGSLSAARRLLPYMDPSHYWGFEKSRDLFEAGVRLELPRVKVRPERGHFIVNDWFDLSECPHEFDFALANGFWARLPLNSIARCTANVLKKLAPGGRFFATWFDNPDASNFEPIVHAAGATSYPDMPPYHYPFAQLAGVCEALGATVERIDDAAHPRGECVMVVRRR
jgi:ABC-type polysaccharide/polyol phosphate transport system ATPase subunit/SAM-dependent methyltransferase